VSDCTFCDIAAGAHPAHTVLADERIVAFLDARQHYVTLADLPAALLEPFFAGVQLISALLPVALGAQGTFVAINNVVSQSVPHLHAHVVPRTKGDGLRGFFWPRTRYASDAEAAGYAARIRAAVEAEPGWAPPSS
jgi:histidine triad (HIT) family protein